MLIELALIADAAEILALQKRAYVSEAEIYGDYEKLENPRLCRGTHKV
jgi:hypothetical protein